MPLDVEALSRRLVGALIRRRREVLGASILLSAVGIFFAVQLYLDLRSDIEALLPQNAPSVLAAKTVSPLLHNINHLSIILEGSDPEAIQRLADKLAARLRDLPPEQVESVDYRTDEESAFLSRFGLFYLSIQDLQTILDRIRKRVAWEKKKANPLLGLVEQEETPPPPLDFSDIEAKYSVGRQALSQFRNGYYQTPDGHLLAMIVRPPEGGSGYSFNKALFDRAQHEVHDLNPKSFDPTMRIGYDGEIASLVEEQEALVADLALSSALVAVLVLGALWIYFRRWGAIAAILGALTVGCSITFGLTYFLIGHLNANTAFLGSIVAGNGINVAIIIVARYVEERRRGREIADAARIALRRTFGATFVAAFASGLAYLSLSLTDFRGFKEFGVIGGLGMALCWLSAILVLPPLLSMIERIQPMSRAAAYHGSPVTSRIVEFVQNYRRPIQVFCLLSIAGAVVAVLNYQGNFIEYDITRLRAKKSIESGAIYWGYKFDKVFNAYFTPIVIVGDTADDLDRAVARLEARRVELGSGDPIREIRTFHTSIPYDQKEKLEIIRQLRAELTESRLKLLSPEQRKELEKYRPPDDLVPVTIQDLPKAVRLPLMERDGTIGRVALAFPRKVGVLDPRDLEQIAGLIRGSIADSGAKAQAVGQSLLFNDILVAIVQDGPKATLLALFAAMLVVVLVFRRLRPSLTVLAGLLLGVVWLVGLAAATHVRINFLNFVVLPITFGIGVDYSVNIIQRYRLEGRGSLARVIRETGGAVALCSSTTVIGYASLFVADNRALAGFGLLASLGEASCLTAALFALPAWLMGREASVLKDPEEAEAL